MNETDPTALGAYIFAGGFTVGVKDAGFNVLAHLEGNDYGVSTARLNFPGMPIHVGRPTWPLDSFKGRVDFLYCNPPCAPWSANGIRSQGKENRGIGAWRTDPRVSCWRDCFDAFAAIRPRVFAVESVTGVYSDGRDMIDEYTRRALLIGYSVTHLYCNAKWTGLPQSRNRFFFVAHRASHFAVPPSNWAPPPTIGEVLGSVAEPGFTVPTIERHAYLLEHAKPGESLARTWMNITPEENRVVRDDGKMAGRPFASNRRLPIDKPMGAFTGNTMYHPTVNRALGIEEAKAICGYPPSFQFAGSPSIAWWALLARAVMPPVGEWMGRCALNTMAEPDAEWHERSVRLLERRVPNVADVDLTGEYLDAKGRVRLRVRADVNGMPPVTPVPPSDRPADPKPPRRISPPPAVPFSRVLANGITDAERPLPREGSGAFIRRLWMTGRYTPEDLVALVHANWEGRTTAIGDVRYNYYVLLKAGVPDVPRWPSRSDRAPPSLPRPPAPVPPPRPASVHPVPSSGRIDGSVAAYLEAESG